MANNDIRLIIQGGTLCAAFSFLIFMWPVPGLITKFFSLTPIFYVGICLGVRACSFAMAIPLIWMLIMLGVSQTIALLLLFVPVLVILRWHLLKVKGGYVNSFTDVLHLFASHFLYVIVAIFCALKFFDIAWLEGLQKSFDEAAKLMQVQAPNGVMEFLPSGAVFLWLLMIWVNFQTAYGIALKTNMAKHKPKVRQNINLKPIWDIALVGAMWLVLLNSLLINSLFLAVFSRVLLGVSAFPLFIDGLETAQIIARANKYPPIAIRISLVITFMLVWPIIFVVLLGLVEPWYGLKQKYLSKLN